MSSNVQTPQNADDDQSTNDHGGSPTSASSSTSATAQKQEPMEDKAVNLALAVPFIIWLTYLNGAVSEVSATVLVRRFDALIAASAAMNTILQLALVWWLVARMKEICAAADLPIPNENGDSATAATSSSAASNRASRRGEVMAQWPPAQG